MTELRDKIADALAASRSELRPLVNELSGAVAAFKIVAYRERFLELVEQAFEEKLDTHLVLDAKEAARRSERELALAVLKGRKDGSIESAQDARERSAWLNAQIRLGRSTENFEAKFPKFPLSSFFRVSDIKGKYRHGARLQIWLLAEPSDAEFEKLISKARRSRSLSQVGVQEMILLSQSPEPVTTNPADLPSNRAILSNALEHLHSVNAVLSDISALSADIDQAKATALLADLRPQIATLNRIQKLLKNRAEQ